MVYYPKLCKDGHLLHGQIRSRRAEEAALQAWQRGETGFPIVDAAMRQLNATGWMHNRLRMIVASFLTKDLRLDWRAGERYFMSQLIDGDRRRITAAGSGRLQRAPTPRPIFAYLTPPPVAKSLINRGVYTSLAAGAGKGAGEGPASAVGVGG